MLPIIEGEGSRSNPAAINVPTTTKFAIRFRSLFSNSSITFKFLLLTRGSSTASFSTDVAKSSPFFVVPFFFFGVVPVCLRYVLQI
jgi:hypothetical protein